MQRIKGAVCGVGIALAGLFAAPAWATVLTFDIDRLGSEADIPADYGDNVTGDGVPDTDYHYVEGSGWTPNIAVEYATVDQDQATYIAPALKLYTSGYTSTNVAYPVVDVQIAEISFVPDAGYSVRINSFDLASYGPTEYAVDLIQITDAARTVTLWSSSESAIGPTTETFLPAYTGAPGQTLRLQFGSTYNVAFDSISFAQVAIPEPASVMLLALAAAPLLARRRA